jgi:hypothetical protein
MLLRRRNRNKINYEEDYASWGCHFWRETCREGDSRLATSFELWHTVASTYRLVATVGSGLSRNEYTKIPSFSLERSNSTDKPPPKDFDQIPVILTFIDPMAPYSSLPTHIPPYLVGVEQRDEYIRRVRPVQILRKLIYIDTQLTFWL